MGKGISFFMDFSLSPICDVKVYDFSSAIWVAFLPSRCFALLYKPKLSSLLLLG